MARIIGGIGTSHAPSLARAFDTGKRNDPEWADLFTQFDVAKQWLTSVRPDVIIAFYNDHLNQFFFDAYPTFSIGVGDPHPIADEGWGKRPFPDLAGHPALAQHITRSLVSDEFDMTICQETQIDHGVLSPLPFLTDERWSVPAIPVQINVIQHPLPTPRRCFRLGQAIRRAVQSFADEDLRVAVMGTGGLSHQLSGKRFGFVNPDWDTTFMSLLASNPDALIDITHEELMIKGGVESVEVMMWMAMRGALASKVRVMHSYYAAPMLTGYGLLVLEED